MISQFWQPGMTLESMEKMCILSALRFYRGNKTQCSIALGISIRTLDNKLEKYENDAKDEKARDDKWTADRKSALDRLRGGEAQAKQQAESVYGTPPRLHVEPAAKASPQHIVPMPKREEVQALPPEHVAGSGQERGSQDAIGTNGQARPSVPHQGKRRAAAAARSAKRS